MAIRAWLLITADHREGREVAKSAKLSRLYFRIPTCRDAGTPATGRRRDERPRGQREHCSEWTVLSLASRALIPPRDARCQRLQNRRYRELPNLHRAHRVIVNIVKAAGNVTIETSRSSRLRDLVTLDVSGKEFRRSVGRSPDSTQASKAPLSALGALCGERLFRPRTALALSSRDLHQSIVWVDVIDGLGRDELVLDEDGRRHRPAVEDIERDGDDLGAVLLGKVRH